MRGEVLRPSQRVMLALGIKRRHGAGNEEGRQQAQQHMGRQVGGEIACTAVQEVQSRFHRMS